MRTTPTALINTTKLVEPAEMNGKGSPVGGIEPDMTYTFEVKQGNKVLARKNVVTHFEEEQEWEMDYDEDNNYTDEQDVRDENEIVVSDDQDEEPIYEDGPPNTRDEVEREEEPILSDGDPTQGASVVDVGYQKGEMKDEEKKRGKKNIKKWHGS